MVARQKGLRHSNRTRVKREGLRRDMIATFQLLTDAVALGRHCGYLYARRPEDELLKQWVLCHRTAGQLGKDYAAAVARYRRTIRDSVTSRVRREP